MLVVMGVSGSGKSTVARLLADRLGWDFAEGDNMHTQANKDKMAAGYRLHDQDRRPWLDKIAEWIRQHLEAARPGIVTSLALRRVYRDHPSGPGVVFVHLAGTRDLIADRIGHRHDHFMPPCLLRSQLDTLEPPDADEAAITVDVTPEADKVVDEVPRVLHLATAATANPSARADRPPMTAQGLYPART